MAVGCSIEAQRSSLLLVLYFCQACHIGPRAHVLGVSDFIRREESRSTSMFLVKASAHNPANLERSPGGGEVGQWHVTASHLKHLTFEDPFINLPINRKQRLPVSYVADLNRHLSCNPSLLNCFREKKARLREHFSESSFQCQTER